jgi:hypothetical protein
LAFKFPAAVDDINLSLQNSQAAQAPRPRTIEPNALAEKFRQRCTVNPMTDPAEIKRHLAKDLDLTVRRVNQLLRQAGN